MTCGSVPGLRRINTANPSSSAQVKSASGAPDAKSEVQGVIVVRQPGRRIVSGTHHPGWCDYFRGWCRASEDVICPTGSTGEAPCPEIGFEHRLSTGQIFECLMPLKYKTTLDFSRVVTGRANGI